MPDDDLARKGNPPSKDDIQKARDAYDHANRRKRKLKRAYINSKHTARKAKHFLQRLVDRRKGSKGKHSFNKVLDGICAWARWGVANEPSIHYRQSRPIPNMDNPYPPRDLPLYTDCSGSSTIAAYEAGGGDPNGFNFSGPGYTGTFLSACQHVSREDAKAGYFCVFGSGTGTHVVILMEDGSKADPTTMSHGQESGPRYYPLSVEASAHAGQPLTFLKPPKK